jgi:DNA-binding response OmpR family regulator
MSKRRVLIVDDDQTLLECLQTWLREAGHDVATLDRADDVVGSLQAQAADVLLLDLMMPTKDGLQIIGEVRAAGWHGPIVLYSAYPYPERLGAQPGVTLLRKPFDLDALLGALEQAR